MTRAEVAVDVATVWSDPERPREVDAPALADLPDLRAWTVSMDAATRLGLHGRTETQLLRGEPVEVLRRRDEWTEIAAPWQPTPLNELGYPGWVRSAHLRELTADNPGEPAAVIAPDRLAVMAAARQFVGLRYLWGGLSPWGLDCSGLVHYSYRQGGVVVPRDAYAQHDVATPVVLGDEQPGDLYFFARPGQRVFHVGFVSGRLRMLHAPEGGELIEDAPLSQNRRDVLVGAGRFLDV